MSAATFISAGLSAGAASAADASLDGIRAAAEAGSPDAQFQLGWRCEGGPAGRPDAQAAATWYERAARQGHVGAQCNLGRMLYEGRGVARDPERALDFTRRAAEAGLAQAQHNLGLWLCWGESIRRDGREGARWLERAARQGYAKAQADLGTVLAEGRGIPRDRIPAAKWTQKAALQGVPLAMEHLAYFFARGEGIPRDYVEAYVWYALAADRGRADATNGMHHARMRMTTRQIHEADRRIAAFKPLAASALQPVVRLDRVSVLPPAVAGGSLFDLKAELLVSDLRTVDDELVLDFRFRILKDGRERFRSGATRCRAGNGRPSKVMLSKLPSATRTGAYELEASVEYDCREARRTVAFEIK